MVKTQQQEQVGAGWSPYVCSQAAKEMDAGAHLMTCSIHFYLVQGMASSTFRVHPPSLAKPL